MGPCPGLQRRLPEPSCREDHPPRPAPPCPGRVPRRQHWRKPRQPRPTPCPWCLPAAQHPGPHLYLPPGPSALIGCRPLPRPSPHSPPSQPGISQPAPLPRASPHLPVLADTRLAEAVTLSSVAHSLQAGGDSRPSCFPVGLPDTSPNERPGCVRHPLQTCLGHWPWSLHAHLGCMWLCLLQTCPRVCPLFTAEAGARAHFLSLVP